MADVAPMRHGWFAIPGVQTGDRSIEEQLTALLPALAEASGKTVLDLGCAEGLLGRAFAQAGAKHVHGMESVRDHLAVARRVCKGLAMSFELAELNQLPEPKQYDIVLALGIIHKLHDPGAGLRWAASCARDLFLIRSGRGDRNGIIHSKHRRASCDRDAVLREAGLELERTVQGPSERLEDVQYWRRA